MTSETDVSHVQGRSPIDMIMRRVLPALCSLLLVLMVGFTVYTVVMRGVFDDPPFWGDTLTMFSNIWLVLLAFPITLWERSSIAMNAIDQLLSQRAVRVLSLFWNVLFVLMGLLLLVYGYQVASRIPGAYWELGNLPKSVPMMILPVTGLLATAAALLVVREDWRVLRGRQSRDVARPG